MKNFIGKIAYYWFLFMLIIVGFFSGKLFVKGATITPTSDQWLTQWCSDRTCDYTLAGSTYNTGFVDRNVSYSNTNDYYLTTLRIRQQFTSPNLQSGVSYSLRYKVNFNPKYWSLYNANSNWDYELSVTNTSNATSSITGVCTFGNYSNDNYAIYIQCNYTPSANLKQVAVIIRFPFTIYTSAQNFSGYLYRSIDSINYKAYNVSYATSTIDAIDQQTNIIREQTTIINDSVNTINDNITDSDVDNPNDFLEDIEDLMPENGVITQLLALPITLYNKVLSSINGTCSQFNLGSLYGTNLIMPCIDVVDYLGSTIWGLLDLIISGGFVLMIARKMIKAFNNFTSLKEGDVIND